jgi:methyl-accepting chemotaxis protein
MNSEAATLLIETPDASPHAQQTIQELQAHYHNALNGMLPCLDAQTALYSKMHDMLSGVIIGNEFVNTKNFHDHFSDTLDKLIENILFVSKRAVKMLYVLDEAVTSLATIERSVSTIRSITQKANILALNASIEATKAGQAGDGFNIVAIEMRSVSDHIKDITQQVNRSLQSVGQVVASSMEIIEEIGHADMSDNMLAKHRLDIMVSALTEQNQALHTLLTDTEENHRQLLAAYTPLCASSAMGTKAYIPEIIETQ